MGIKAALVTRLEAESAVTDELKQYRGSWPIYQGQAPKEVRLRLHSKAEPYVTFRQDDSEGISHLGAAAGIAHVFFEIQTWAPSTAVRELLADAIRDATDGFRTTTVAGVDIRSIDMTQRGRDFEDAPTKGSEKTIFRTIQEIEVWHALAVPAF